MDNIYATIIENRENKAYTVTLFPDINQIMFSTHDTREIIQSDDSYNAFQFRKRNEFLDKIEEIGSKFVNYQMIDKTKKELEIMINNYIRALVMQGEIYCRFI